MTENDRRSLIAATQANTAVAELLRFHVEGPASDRAFGDIDLICFLAEAMALACEIEVDHLKALPHCAEEVAEVEQLRATAAKFIEGWAG